MGYSDGFNSVAQLFDLQNNRNRLKESRRQFDLGLAEKQRALDLANEQFYVTDTSANRRHTETIVGAKDRLSTQIAADSLTQQNRQEYQKGLIKSEREYKKSQLDDLQQAIYDVGDYYIKRTTAGEVSVEDKKTGKAKVVTDPALLAQINAIGSKQPVPKKEEATTNKSIFEPERTVFEHHVNRPIGNALKALNTVTTKYNPIYNGLKFIEGLGKPYQSPVGKAQVVGTQQPMNPRVLQEFNVAQNEPSQQLTDPVPTAPTIPSSEERQAVARLAAMTGDTDLYTKQYAPGAMSLEGQKKNSDIQYNKAKTLEVMIGTQQAIYDQNNISLADSQKAALSQLGFMKTFIGDAGIPDDEKGTRDLVFAEMLRAGNSIFGNTFASPEFMQTYGSTIIADAAKSRYMYPNTSAEGALMTQIRKSVSGISEDEIETWNQLSTKAYSILSTQFEGQELQQVLTSLFSGKRTNAEVLDLLAQISNGQG